jgi:quercetin dioxygenase-like cupin family protein
VWDIVRIVVTGHSPTGHSQVVSDGPPNLVGLPGTGALVRLKGLDYPETYPYDGRDGEAPEFFPPVGGMRACVVHVLSEEEAAGVPGELDEVAPGLAKVMEAGRPGMHQTDTTDIVYVINGTVELTLDRGESLLLGAGDVVVQNGTRHRWRNPSVVPAELLIFMVGAKRAPGRARVAERPAPATR